MSWSLAALILAASALAAAADAPQDQSQPLAGVVVDAQGARIAGIELSFYDAALAPGSGVPLAAATSDARGGFVAALPPDTPLLVELQGPRGRGRTRVPADRLGQPWQLRYPVRTTGE